MCVNRTAESNVFAEHNCRYGGRSNALCHLHRTSSKLIKHQSIKHQASIVLNLSSHNRLAFFSFSIFRIFRIFQGLSTVLFFADVTAALSTSFPHIIKDRSLRAQPWLTAFGTHRRRGGPSRAPTLRPWHRRKGCLCRKGRSHRRGGSHRFDPAA
jgi:hypothetical protein